MKIKIIIYEDEIAPYRELLERTYKVHETDGAYDCAPDINLQNLVDDACNLRNNVGLNEDAPIIDALEDGAKVGQELETEIT